MNNVRKKFILGFIKWVFLLGMLAGSVIFFMLTPLFDVTNVEVKGNYKLSEESIQSLSNIQLGINIFKISKKDVMKNIKANPYIDSVEVRRSFPSIVKINIKERQARFSVDFINGYIHIDNQGYLLEVSSEKPNLITIIGAETKLEQVELGQRLEINDLEKLQVVHKILEAATSNDMYNLITEINIENGDNYILWLEDEDKEIYIGDGSDLNTKMLYIQKILNEERGKKGEIIINEDVNKTRPYFREEI